MEFPCIEKLTPEIMEKFNFDKKLAIERYMDLLRLITKCETRLDFENAMMKKYRTQVKLAMSYAKKSIWGGFSSILKPCVKTAL